MPVEVVVVVDAKLSTANLTEYSTALALSTDREPTQRREITVARCKAVICPCFLCLVQATNWSRVSKILVTKNGLKKRRKEIEFLSRGFVLMCVWT